MKKHWYTALTACVVLALLCAPVLASPDSERREKAKYTWKLATLAPKGVGWAIHTNNFLIPWVEEVSKGDVYIKVYWGGVMGDEKSVIHKMHVGQLQGGGFSGQGAALLCPEFAVFELPFLFRNWEEVDFIKDQMTATMDKYMAEQGFKLLLWNDQDFDQLYSTKYRFDKMEDFKKAKFFTWYGPLEVAVLQKLGANPIPVDVPEAPTMIRQHVADSAVAPALFVVGAQMYNVIKYVNPVKIRYSPSPVVGDPGRLETASRELPGKICQGPLPAGEGVQRSHPGR